MCRSMFPVEFRYIIYQGNLVVPIPNGIKFNDWIDPILTHIGRFTYVVLIFCCGSENISWYDRLTPGVVTNTWHLTSSEIKNKRITHFAEFFSNKISICFLELFIYWLSEHNNFCYGYHVAVHRHLLLWDSTYVIDVPGSLPHVMVTRHVPFVQDHYIPEIFLESTFI